MGKIINNEKQIWQRCLGDSAAIAFFSVILFQADIEIKL